MLGGVCRRMFGGLAISPYFGVNSTIAEIKAKHAMRSDLPDERVELRTGGRIIGRRKASSSLMFLDLESNGSTIQVMLEQKTLRNDFSPVV